MDVALAEIKAQVKKTLGTQFARIFADETQENIGTEYCSFLPR